MIGARSRYRPARAGSLILALTLTALSAPAIALATDLPLRTFDISSPLLGGVRTAESTDPSLSASGRFVAYDAVDPGEGALSGASSSDVYLVDFIGGTRTLVSGVGGVQANGPSSEPVVSGDGSRVAFVSSASDLVSTPTDGLSNIFVRDSSGAITLVSSAISGTPNGASSEPSMSANGRFVAFVSSATNLVPGDNDTEPKIFVRDLSLGKTTLVSVSPTGAEPNGGSTNPAISADGNVVSFDSTATNLVRGVHNHVSNVYLRVLASRRTQLISVATSGAQQNRAVAHPLHQISSVSAGGRYVAFDSTATNLIPHDSIHRSQVFVRDRKRHTTRLVSESITGLEGNGDSFAPSISANGRYVAFASFATNLAPAIGPDENVLVHDLVLDATSVVDAGPTGATPGREQLKNPRERPALSANGRAAAFTSSARNLTRTNGPYTHVLVRLLDPPRTITVKRPTDANPVVFSTKADDPAATIFLCKLDQFPLFLCARGRVRFPPLLTIGRHVLTVRAGGPGMLFDPIGVRFVFTVRH